MTTPDTTPRLWTPHGFCDDDAWHHIESADDLAGNGRFILPLPAFLELDEATRGAFEGRLGVLLTAADPVESLATHIEGLALVALSFPAFSDGRSFSKAQLLRTRFGYDGPMRAVGDVLIDLIPHMIRTGFTEFEVTNPTALKRLAADDLPDIPMHYQPSLASDERSGKYAWRRVPTA